MSSDSKLSRSCVFLCTVLWAKSFRISRIVVRSLAIRLLTKDGARVKYYEVELENVLIGSMDQVVHEGSGLHDAFTLKFSKVKWKYTYQKIGGGSGGNTHGGWDLATNHIAC